MMQSWSDIVVTVSAAVHPGCAVLVVHQVALSFGLIEVIHADARGPQLWHLNKEGLLSLPGYWALSLLSVGLSSYLHPDYGRPDQTGAKVADRWGCGTCSSGATVSTVTHVMFATLLLNFVSYPDTR